MDLLKKDSELIASVLEQMEKEDGHDDVNPPRKIDLFNTLYKVAKKQCANHVNDLNFEITKVIMEDSNEGDITIKTSLSVLHGVDLLVFKTLATFASRVQITGLIEDEISLVEPLGVAEISFIFDDLYADANKYINELKSGINGIS